MSSPVRRDTRRYRRRILAMCAAITTLGFVITAPIFLDRVEADLETRVPDELAQAGYPGLTASFSGQDGTLACAAPLTDPEAARQAAYDIWGVRAIELDRSCRVNTAAADEADGVDDVGATSLVDESDGSSAAAEPTDPTEPSSPTSTTVAASTTLPAEPAFPTVADAVVGSPQLSLLAVLLQESGLASEFADPTADPVTLFAATDDAFEALPADTLAEIRGEPDLLRALVLHHTADGRIAGDNLVTGPIEMLDGAELPLDADVPSIAGVTISVVDIDTGNGVVHVIDEVIFPDGLDAGPATMASATATFDGAELRLSGTVATEAIRVLLVAAAADDIDVLDELGVDPDGGVEPDMGDRMAGLVGIATTRLNDAVVTADGDELDVTGTAADEAGRDAVVAAAAEADATADISVVPEPEPEPEPEPDPAAGLETILNAFVTDNPILFQPSSALITDESVPALDRIAEFILDVDGVIVTVEGHTDSDGDPDDNLTLSRLRAFAVEQALIERGVSADRLEFEGFGSERPVLDDGVEDKAASRRVEFRVVPRS